MRLTICQRLHKPRVNLSALAGRDSFNFTPHSFSILANDRRQYFSSDSMPMAWRPFCKVSIMVVPLPLNGSSTVSPRKENNFTHRRGNSRGNGASCPTRFALSPLKLQIPKTQFLNSSPVMSLVPCRSRFHASLNSTITTSTGAMICGALADCQLPQAVRREMLPSFHKIVA